MEFVTRFAPSPTGQLHLGHAFSALTAYRAAREAGGRFLLRIEDIDVGRCRPEFEAAIYQDLEWLGLAWEAPVRRQSNHFDDYAVSLNKLRERGVLYRCFRTRKEIAEASASAPHAGDILTETGADSITPISAGEEAEKLATGMPYAWRLSLRYSQDLLGEEFTRLEFEETGEGPNAERGRITARPKPCGDVILARKDISASYHLAVVHDDALQGVTHVIRGVDLFKSTSIHALLQRLLDLPTPTYYHHRLMTGPDGKRYAKRDRAPTLAALRDDGVTPAQIRLQLGFPD